MSREQLETLLQAELEIYRNIDELLKNKTLIDTNLINIVNKQFNTLAPLLKQQTTLMEELLNDPSFQETHRTFYYFIQHTAQLDTLTKTDYNHCCANIFKLMQCPEGISLIKTLNVLHKLNGLKIEVTPTNRHNLSMKPLEPDYQYQPPPQTTFLSSLLHFFSRYLSYLHAIVDKPQQKIRGALLCYTSSQIHYPEQYHQKPPLLLTGLNTPFIIRIGFIALAHELLHVLHYATKDARLYCFPYKRNQAINWLYTRHTFEGDHEEWQTIESTKTRLTENTFRHAFKLSQRSGIFSFFLHQDKNTLQQCETICTLFKKRHNGEILTKEEQMQLSQQGLLPTATTTKTS